VDTTTSPSRRLFHGSISLRHCCSLPFLVSLLGLLTSVATAQTIYQIDLRGHMSLLSNDRPIQRGRLALFHRYSDGVFLSISEAEIVRVVTASASPTSKALLPGEAIDVGPTGGNDRSQVTAPEASAAPGPGNDSPYGPMTPGYYGYGGPPRTRGGAGAAAPPLAGPNSFPMSPGAVPSVMGPNGFPAMAPARGRQ
jgi:hypothetical protein